MIRWFWNKPALAAGITGIALGGAFAGATVALGSVDAPGNMAFTGFSSADSAAIVFALGILAAALFFIALIRNWVARIAIAARGAARKGGGGGSELGEYAATLEIPLIGAQSYLGLGLLVSEVAAVVAAIVLAATQ